VKLADHFAIIAFVFDNQSMDITLTDTLYEAVIVVASGRFPGFEGSQ
jgi:hypothetical protein